MSWYRSRFGLLPALFAYSYLRIKGIGRAPNPITGGYVFIRPGTADQVVYEEVFVTREYDLDLGDPRFIVDAGAHIGLSAVYFAGKYPGAIVVAIEPEPSNFKMLLMNASQHANVKPIRAGLWSRKAFLRIEDSCVETWSFRVVESATNEGIQAVGIGDIMSGFAAREIDVLKIDIEGSEVEVLSHSHSWIDCVKTLVIELHDRFRPGCTEALENALRGRSFDRSRSGESTVIRNLKRTGD